ncbi:hypothetical protein V7S43_013772 [Phytophthora oleae]|uniref:WRKY19-like zinc finger domain-containing protein n=1 Tax=Phytophthora oleae TaxID=2107226 RepID=A0ABD3F358_9STRA
MNSSENVLVDAKAAVPSSSSTSIPCSSTKRKARECKVSGCENYIINKGLCFRHGVGKFRQLSLLMFQRSDQCYPFKGGKKCSLEGCHSSAKNNGLCWRHGTIFHSNELFTVGINLRNPLGGWIKCQMEGCDRRGKSRGLCWSHGGGTKCSHSDCSKVAVSNGLCWAHGGGKRCVFKGCKKAAYERNNNYCSHHIKQAQSME